jgi:hypothetical protein
MTNTGLGRRTELMIFFGSCRRFELEGKLLAYIVSFFFLSFCSGTSEQCYKFGCYKRKQIT